MTLSLQEVFAKVNAQEDTSIGYVFDAPIHYIVLNREDNSFDTKKIQRFHAFLDQIEGSKAAPGILVTIGTGNRHFSLGFDLKHWAKDFETNMLGSGLLFQKLIARLLTFPMPTVCCMNGNAFSLGCMLALAHDVRIMTTAVKGAGMTFKELQLGITLPVPYVAFATAKLGPTSASLLCYAYLFQAEEALREGLIKGTYTDLADCEKQVKILAKRLSKVGRNRVQCRDVKEG